jgi:pimeloyl-ACP methyl ester carboxylesterase
MFPPAVLAWRDLGRTVSLGGHQIFVSAFGTGSPVLFLHGFPGSSFDWREVARLVAVRHQVVLFDFLGYGLSDKPADQPFSLFNQADLATSVASLFGITQCAVVAHDVGDTVAAELLARQNAGELPFVIDQMVLTNGSIFIDMAGLTEGQLLLLSLPDEPLADRLPAEMLAASLAATFPKPSDEIDAMVSLIQDRGGDRLLPRLIRYIEERRVHQARWTAGFTEFAGPLTALWGALDTIAIPAMPRHLATLRPSTEVVIWPDLGHWPATEDPSRVAAAVLGRLG